MIVDADTHVLETEKTFSYLSKNEQRFRPAVVKISGDADKDSPLVRYGSDQWLIDGQLYGKHDLQFIESRSQGEILPGTLDLSNASVRLDAMDRQGVDTAIVYPSLFLVTAISDPDAELALARSYNRWLADHCAAAPDRFKFVLLVCPRRIEESVREMEWAKQNGASGVLLRGLEGDQTPDQAELRPLFAKACDLDMPICIHIGHGSRSFRAIKMGGVPGRNRFVNRVPTMIACSTLLLGDLHKQFSKLRFAIVEAGSSWLPFLSVLTLRARYSKDKAAAAREALVDHNIFVTCEDHEDLPSILPFAGDDNLVIGSDFGHPGDVADSIHVQRNFLARDDISEAVKLRIMSTNARTLYAL